MAIQSLVGGFMWPDPFFTNRYTIPTGVDYLIDASGEKVGFVFVAPFTGNIDRVFAYVSSKTVNGTLDVRLETVDGTTGFPSGTLVAVNSNGAFTNNASPQVIDVTLTAVGAVTKGTQYAVVVKQAAGACNIQGWGTQGTATPRDGMLTQLTYLCHDAGAGYAKQYTRPNVAIRYDNGNYYPIPGNLPASAITNTTFNNTTSTRERGIAFTLPFPVDVSGFYLLCSAVGIADYDVILANTAGTALATFSGDKDNGTFYFASTNYAANLMGYFSSTVSLSAATKYYLTLKPKSATNNGLVEATLLSAIAAMMGMYNGGTICNLVTRDGAGTYTETTTARPIGMGIICSGFDDGSGGGGGGTTLNIYPCE